MLADAGALGMAIAAQRIASRPRTARQTYGFRRAEVLAAFINGVLLVGVALSVVVEAAHRLGGSHAVHGEAISITAAGGLAVNGLAAWVLARGGRSNVNVRAALAHVISDAMGSVGALVAGLLVAFAGLTWADPVASVFIAALVAANAVRLVRETAHVLMQGSPPGVDCAAIDAAVRRIDGVVDVHDLHVWRISDGYDVLTVHVVVADAASGTTIARAITSLLHETFGIAHATVQPEVVASAGRAHGAEHGDQGAHGGHPHDH
jgi:cobalt-zinc-cadmium efflux system protein